MTKEPVVISGPTNKPIRYPPFAEDKEAIALKYQALNGAPGQPVGPVQVGAGSGAIQRYEHGAIYCKGAPDAWHVHGAIYEKYIALGAEGGFLGYPVSDELVASDGEGRFSDFEHGSIYWHPTIGAWEVHGAIRARWDSLGSAKSYHGYPVSDDADWPQGGAPGGRISRFQRGWIGWAAAQGPTELPDSVTYREDLKTRSAVSGWHELVLNSRGDWVFRGHWRNSGAVPLTCTMAVALNYVLPDKSVLGFQVEGIMDGTFDFGSERNFDWKQSAGDNRIRAHFDQLRNCGITSKFDAGMSIENVIELLIAVVPAAAGAFFVGLIAAGVASGKKKVCPAIMVPGGTDPLTGEERPPHSVFPIVDEGEPCPVSGQYG